MAPRRIEPGEMADVLPPGGLTLVSACSAESTLPADAVEAAGDALGAMTFSGIFVGLLQGAGGTQRLPRLIGIEAALPILLDGIRLGGDRARDVRLVNRLCAAGEEIGLGEQWLLANPGAVQPWDRDDWHSPASISVSTTIAPVRVRVLAETLGHNPASFAILGCIEPGAPQSFDGAIRTEMLIFAHLIQREEARNIIQNLFLAKTDYERLKRADALPDFVAEVEAAARAALEAVGNDPALGTAGFKHASSKPVRDHVSEGYS